MSVPPRGEESKHNKKIQMSARYLSRLFIVAPKLIDNILFMHYLVRA